MRLAISNIAWDPVEDGAVAELLSRYRIDAIDIAPGKYFAEPKKATQQDILKVKDWWADQGIEITGMQALLFGTTGLNVFGSKSSQDDLIDHLTAVCRIGGQLGATRLVFGSPKNRDRSGISDEQTIKIAVDFFQRLGAIAQDYGVMICLEPNPERYGANFMTSSDETAEIVKLVGHQAIKMQFDSGALFINNEDPGKVLNQHSQLIGHIHVSEPDLLPIGDCATNHSFIYEVIHQYLPAHIISIEMVATKKEPHLSSIERALNFTTDNYRLNQEMQ